MLECSPRAKKWGCNKFVYWTCNSIYINYKNHRLLAPRLLETSVILICYRVQTSLVISLGFWSFGAKLPKTSYIWIFNFKNDIIFLFLKIMSYFVCYLLNKGNKIHKKNKVNYSNYGVENKFLYNYTTILPEFWVFY